MSATPTPRPVIPNAHAVVAPTCWAALSRLVTGVVAAALAGDTPSAVVASTIPAATAARTTFRPAADGPVGPFRSLPAPTAPPSLVVTHRPRTRYRPAPRMGPDCTQSHCPATALLPATTPNQRT